MKRMAEHDFNPKTGTLNATGAPLQGRLQALNQEQVEALLAGIFEQQGYCVQRCSSARTDASPSLILSRNAEKEVHYWGWAAGTIDAKEIWQFLGTLTRSQLERGVVLAAKDFTEEARRVAEQHWIRLLDATELGLMLAELSWTSDAKLQAVLNGRENQKKRAA